SRNKTIQKQLLLNWTIGCFFNKATLNRQITMNKGSLTYQRVGMGRKCRLTSIDGRLASPE
ncbi:MAG: hypothetical protein L3J13_08015, partial [Devosiaceae bacterium]|nr:hypothetical protein [Devosiaceae bacterium]